MAGSGTPILELDHVSKSFGTGESSVHAVKDVSLRVSPGETVALVGESGSGKSTLGRIALALLRPDAGRVLLMGRSLLDLSPGELRRARRTMQPIFQDATASLNPRRTVRQLLAQALVGGPEPMQERSIDLLEQVGLRPAQDMLRRRPHELSGGQRQRLCIARALACKPALLIADEPLSGADVSIRGQILNLLLDLKEQQNVAYFMITHDISIASAFADRVLVMRHGEIVESGAAAEVLRAPQHEYTRRLVAAVPTLAEGPVPESLEAVR
jgi:ABC-type glutathione transport system ATPase component